MVIRALRGTVPGWFGRGVLNAALVVLLFRRLGEICGQMERLAQRFQAGRLWRLAPRAGDAGGAVGAWPARVRVSRIWPGRFGWLLKAAAHHAAVYNGQLRVILQTPEMVELLMAAPQAARILRPLCRMLAVEDALLRPGVVVAEPVAVVVRKRVRRPRVPVDWGRIPLPRGVLSWARREGFGKVPRD